MLEVGVTTIWLLPVEIGVIKKVNSKIGSITSKSLCCAVVLEMYSLYSCWFHMVLSPCSYFTQTHTKEGTRVISMHQHFKQTLDTCGFSLKVKMGNIQPFQSPLQQLPGAADIV